MDEQTSLPLHRLGRPPRAWVWVGLLLGGLLLVPVWLYSLFRREVSEFPLPLYTFALLAAGWGCFAHWLAARRRVRGLARLSKALGLSFTEEVPGRELRRYADLPLFRLTAGLAKGYADNRMEGTFEGRAVVVLEYYFEGDFVRRAGRRDRFRHKGRQPLVLIPGVALPDFVLYPRTCLWHETDPLWYQKLVLPWPTGAGDEHFRRRYELRGPDPEAVWRLFTDARTDYFLASPGWSVECSSGRLLIYREEETLSAQRLPALLYKALDVLAVLTEGPQREAAPPVRSEQVQGEAPPGKPPDAFRP
jgi:hypothetical protein